jgi:hypothetical protein
MEQAFSILQSNELLTKLFANLSLSHEDLKERFVALRDENDTLKIALEDSERLRVALEEAVAANEVRSTQLEEALAAKEKASSECDAWKVNKSVHLTLIGFDENTQFMVLRTAMSVKDVTDGEPLISCSEHTNANSPFQAQTRQ